MSSFATFEQAVGSVLTLRGVKRCVIASRDEDSLRGTQDEEALSRTILLTARDLARSLLVEGGERKSERLLGHVIVARRFEDIAVAVIGNELVDENEVHRKLNVIAIRVQVTTSREGPGPLANSLREVYVAVAGPISGMVFDRAFEELKRTRRPIDSTTLRAFAESLAAPLTPPTNYRMRERFLEVMSTWDTPSGSFKAAAPVRAAAPAPTPAAAFAPPLRRPTTVPKMAAVQQVVRGLVGPLGDLLVQRALENAVGREAVQTGEPMDTDKLIETISAQLPAQHRERFAVETRAAVNEQDASAFDDQRTQRK